MTDRDALLAGVLAAPADDLPRLVYADYVEEHARSEADRARAEFIRCQIEAYREPDLTASDALDARAEGLRRAFLKAWLPGLSKRGRDRVRFGRGFPDTLVVRTNADTAELLERPPAELGAADGLEAEFPLALFRPLDPERVAAVPGLARVRRLAVSGTSGARVDRLLAAPVWGGLDELSTDRLPDDPLPPGHFAAVRRLSVQANQTTGPLPAAAFPVVTDLCVIESVVIIDGPRPANPGWWGDSPLAHRLTRLVWHGRPRVPARWLDLAAGRLAPGLTDLHVSPPAGPDRDAAFAAALDLPRLRVLGFGDRRKGARRANPFAAALARHPRLARLETLDLSAFDLSAASVIGLIDSPRLANLKRLSVTVPHHHDALAEYLRTADLPLRLAKLYVGGSELPAAVRERLGPRLEAVPDTPARLDRLRRTRPDF